MCGISGIISNHPVQSASIQASIKSIKHRGPDDTLIYGSAHKMLYSTEISDVHSRHTFPDIEAADESDCWFAFNRLSIVDLSHYAMQPFCENELVFMMNGEIYNYKELKLEYLRNETFFSDSDSEIAFKLYLKFGNDFVNFLKGMFVVTIYDAKNKILRVWRDRLGIKPFYYAMGEGMFIFSSEMKGILSTGLVKKQVNPTGLAYSMYLGTCPAPHTIYLNIQALQAGHSLEFRMESFGISIRPYWCLEYHETDREIPFDDFSRDILKICEDYSSGEVEKAIMISGGIDSACLSYFYGKVDPKINTIHIHDQDKKEFFEAESNARNAGLEFTTFEIPFEPAKEEILLFLSSEEEPNLIPEPALFLSKKAGELGVKVLYNALGPDEIFGGYGYYSKISKLLKFKFLINHLPAIMLPPRYKSKIRELREYDLEIYPFISRRLFAWEDIHRLFHMNGFQVPDEHPLLFLKKQVRGIYAGFDNLPLMKKMSYYDIFYYIASHHSFRSDQPSMRYGIEMRFPFLEHGFVEKYFNQKNTFRGIGKTLKPRFRNYVIEILPENVLKMKKSGFTMPLKNWIRDSTQEIDSKTWYLMGLKEIFKEFKY
jgi:asparagine synthase (glutamine-hydrolysing)